MTTITETTEAVSKRLDELRTQMKNEGREALQAVFRQLFEQFPQIKTVYWAQYTPYFNDGDACTFRINEVNFSPVEWEDIDGPYFGEEADEEDQQDFSITTYRGSDHRVTPEMEAAMEAVSKFLNAIEDQLPEIYRDHSWVRVHKDGAVVKDHNHD